MNRIILIIFISLGFLSCTLNRNILSGSSYLYSLHFSKITELEEMEDSRYGMGYTTDGKYLYAVNGSSVVPFYTTDIVRYDITSDEWSILTNKLTPKRYISAEYVAGKIYVFNGYKPNGKINKKVEVVDPLTGEISYMSDNPSPVSYSGTAVWEKKIYVFGGVVGEQLYYNQMAFFGPVDEQHYYNQMYLFDPINDLWKLLGVIPEHKHARGEIVEGILYVFGGYYGQVSSKIHAYDIANNTWYYLGDMPVRISANAITKNGNFIWLVGDYTDLNLLAVFNTKTGEFHLVKSNMYGRRHAAAEIVNNKLYVYGGNRASSRSFLSSIQVADIKEIESQLTFATADAKHWRYKN